MSWGTTDNLLGGRLQGARKAAFVGRTEEQAAFDAALIGGGFNVLWVHGPGGIGKSTLLRRFALQASMARRSVALLDGRTMAASPETFEAEAGPVLNDERAVLLIDTFERIRGLEGWLRERFLPRLPVGALVVVASRTPPDMTWQADPGWADALGVVPLRELPPEDARALLATRGVALNLHEPLLTFAGGNPLALSLGAAVAVKDQQASSRWAPDQDVVATLLDQLVGEVPSTAHREVLDVCAHTYMTTEELLRAVVPGDVAPLFAWLRRLPFIESSALGLHPHDVVREVLEADLRWRDPQGYAAMHERIRSHLTEKVCTAADQDVLPAVGSLFFLRRRDAMISHFQTFSGPGEAQEDAFHQEDPEDVDTLKRVVTVVDNEEAAALALYWAERQPQAFRVYRWTETGEPVAFFAWLRLEEPDKEEIAADPVVAAAWAHARATAPQRAGEHIAVCRSWIMQPYHGKSPVTDLIEWRAIGHCLRATRMSWSFIVKQEPDLYRGYMGHYDMYEIGQRPGVGEREYGVFSHDWRAVPVDAWLQRLTGLPQHGTPEPADAPPARLAVLSREEFAAEVRTALRRLARPSALSDSPLTRTRLITEHHVPDPAAALRDVLEHAIEELREDPRAHKLHRAMTVTYLGSAPTQEAAAELLNLPFTTYRRHLATGIERICTDLWHRELYGN